MKTNAVGGRKAIALSIACALMLPLAAHAQSTSTREAQLETRVNQLEQQLAELKAMIQEQKAATAQATATAQAAQTQAQQTQTRVDTVAATPASSSKPVFSSSPGVSVALHGFINATAFSQSKNYTYGNGQNAQYPIPGNTGAVNNSLSGVDVRNTRFWLDFSGAKFAGDWTGGGRIEMDFFGGFNGTGAYAQQQPINRLRQAYMDLTNAETGSTVRIGQQWDLLFPLETTPTSLSHVAFPLGYGTGIIGWRFPGVVWMQDLNHGSDGPKWRLDLGAFEGSWNGPGLTTNYLTAGNAGFKPQIEARLGVRDKTWMVFAAAHYSKVDLHGVDGETVTPIESNIKSTAYEVGGMWSPGQWVFKGLVYTGTAIGQLFGDLSQFGDIKDKGGYLQAGYKFTPNWSAYAFYSQSKPDSDDVVRWLNRGSTGLLKNRQAALSLQYSAGAYDFSVEWIHANLTSTTNGINRSKTSGNEFTLNGNYKF
ncbi:outer membrane murein-binding lipoprotein Lpp [Luteibacter sp. Sphag1AF]|uniref:hypothetical protein n=1 Tax=Luteibacter sp. Sphag1AF TaxID=2587031 RepID=UPI0017A6395E|nr:hypothetical protein [Luteibacter sp. Sphag1AF]MBB3226613.1 outer membrane murein-binding lipoprotein Lpp [Luteibacter sp. Sphag1AF]